MRRTEQAAASRDAPACPHGGAVSKNTHETHKGQHDVIQFRGAMDVLPTTAQTEYCIGQYTMCINTQCV